MSRSDERSGLSPESGNHGLVGGFRSTVGEEVRNRNEDTMDPTIRTGQLDPLLEL